MKLLLDTNVLLDYALRREPFSHDARSLMTIGYFRDAELWGSAKSFTDIFYFATRAVGSTMAQELIERLVSELSICSIGKTDITAALAERWPDFEDCLIYQAARKVKADIIVTRDVAGFGRSQIPVLTPHGLLDYMERERHIVYEEISF